jgi:hypothetical protein
MNFKPDCEEKDHWETPPNVYSTINRTFKPTFSELVLYDPCPRHPLFDGLEVDWPLYNKRDPQNHYLSPFAPWNTIYPIAYVNPPYSRGKQLVWTLKCIEQYDRGVKILLLLPFDTSTKLFNKYLLLHCDLVYTFDKRIRFVGANGSPNFDSALYVFENPEKKIKPEILIRRLEI